MKSRSCLHTAAQFVCQHWFSAKGGCLLQVVDTIDVLLGPLSPQKAFSAACQAGALESTLEYFLSRTTPDWNEAVRAAAKGGQLHVLRWMVNLQDGCGPWKTDFDNVFEVAAAYGRLDVSKWLLGWGTDDCTASKLENSSRGQYANDCSYRYNLFAALELAAANGHLAVVKWLHSVPSGLFGYNPMREAVDGGHLEVAQWLFKKSMGLTHGGVIPSKEGNLQMLQWLHSKRLLSCSSGAFDAAAENGRLAVLQWLYKNFAAESRPAKLYLPIQNGHVEVAKWLDANVPVDAHQNMENSSTIAAGKGHLETLKWLHTRFTDIFSVRDMDEAAKNGHLDVMKWLHEHRSEGCSDMATRHAAQNGHLDVLKWLHTHYPTTFGPAAMDEAAHLEIVQWLHENRPEGCTYHAFHRAASEGHLDVLLYLLEHRTEGFSSHEMPDAQEEIQVLCDFGPDVRGTRRSNRATSDQLKMLQTLFEQQPAFVRDCLRRLARGACIRGNIVLLDWVNQFRIELKSTAPIRHAVSRGYMNMLEWFFNNGFEITDPDLLEVAVGYDQLEAARWLSEHGNTVNSLELVKKFSSVPILRWLVENGPPLDLSTATLLVIKYRYIGIAWWVAEKERAQLALEALRKNDRGVVWWILVHTQFLDESAQRSIRDAIHGCPKDTQQWLDENLSEVETCRCWCFFDIDQKAG